MNSSVSHQNKNLYVLIVEDDDEIRELLVQLLKTEGLIVHHVNNGRSALAKARDHHYDLIFTDWDMDDLSGSEIAKEIRKFDDRVLIAAITGWSLETLLTQAEASVFDKILKKPFELSTIFETVEWAKQAKK